MFRSKTGEETITLKELKALGVAGHGRPVWLENEETKERVLHYFDSVTGTLMPLEEFREAILKRAQARWTPIRQGEFKRERLRRKGLPSGRERSSPFF